MRLKVGKNIFKFVHFQLINEKLVKTISDYELVITYFRTSDFVEKQIQISLRLLWVKSKNLGESVCD